MAFSLGSIGGMFGGANFSGMVGGIVQGITTFIGLLAIALVVGVAGWFYYSQKVYSKKIEVYKKVGGSYMRAGKDVAKVVKIGDMGNEILFLKNQKVFRMTHGIQIDKDTYAFAIDEQGNWHNIGLSDLNKQLNNLMYEIPANDMRLANVNIRRANEKAFGQKNWLKENIGMFVGGIVLIVIVIFLWLMMSKWLGVVGGFSENIKEQQKLAEQNTQMIGTATKLVEAMDNIIKGGGTIRPAAAFMPVLSSLT